MRCKDMGDACPVNLAATHEMCFATLDLSVLRGDWATVHLGVLATL